ncbi:MAG: hypothetical protein KC546_16035 [Anaerolineae bacterium]|nr:hypothetical protein [Anaerolineae bacterium]
MTEKHHIEWDNLDKTVVLQTYEKGAGKADIYQMADKSAEMLNEVDHTVHLIIIEPVSRSVVSPTELKYLDKKVPPNQGMVMLVGGDKFSEIVKTIGDNLNNKAVANLRFVQTPEEARQYLVDELGVAYP